MPAGACLSSDDVSVEIGTLLGRIFLGNSERLRSKSYIFGIDPSSNRTQEKLSLSRALKSDEMSIGSWPRTISRESRLPAFV